MFVAFLHTFCHLVIHLCAPRHRSACFQVLMSVEMFVVECWRSDVTISWRDKSEKWPLGNNLSTTTLLAGWQRHSYCTSNRVKLLRAMWTKKQICYWKVTFGLVSMLCFIRQMHERKKYPHLKHLHRNIFISRMWLCSPRVELVVKFWGFYV